MPQIDKLGRTQAIELAKRMRNKARNADLDAKKLTTRMVGVGSAAGAAYLLGGMMHDREMEAIANAQKIKDGEMDDPTQLLGVDYELAIGIGLTTAGLAMQGFFGGKKATGMLSTVVEGAGAGCLSAAMYEAGRRAAAEADKE